MTEVVKKIVFASANAHKISEIKLMLPKGIELIGLSELEYAEEIPETGKTIPENSLQKAQTIKSFLDSKGHNWPVFADDSGLEVDALNGLPGVNSAMYAGKHGDHEGNNKKLLAELKNSTNRKARFVTVLTYIEGNEPLIFEGEVKGTIAFEPRGASGFGYDPLFIPTGYRSTFAELGPEIKNTISHRGRAIAKLLDYLK